MVLLIFGYAVFEVLAVEVPRKGLSCSTNTGGPGEEKEKTMRRLVILLAAFVTALLLGAGVAFAQTMLCTVIEHLSC